MSPENNLKLHWKQPNYLLSITHFVLFNVLSTFIMLSNDAIYAIEISIWRFRNIHLIIMYIIITKNIRYLLWNRGSWCSLNNTYTIFLTLCIRCTNHLCDSCDLTDVNPHFIPSLLRMIQNADLLWRHRYKSRPPAIVTSQWPIVPPWLLWTLS